MAIQKVIEIIADVKQASKEIKDLFNEMLAKEIEIQKQQAKTNEQVQEMGKVAKDNQKSIKGMADGFKGVGLAIKAMGVGLVLEAFNILKDLFMQNQKVADVFGTAMKSLGIIFNDLFSFIESSVGPVKEFFKAIFEDPIGSLKEFGNLIKENIIERFNSALEVAGFMAEALGKLFEGDFAGALNSVKEAGKEMVDVFTGVDDTTGKIGNAIDKVVEYGKATWETADAMQQLENRAKIAEAQQARLVEQYDRQAEKLRQIRDDEFASIEDRIKANDELGKVLNNQEKAMLAMADAQIASAQNALKLNNNIDNQVALINALANREGVLAQVEGFRSEQIVNRIALEKELIELGNTKLEADSKLASAQAMFEASRKKDTETRLKLEKDALEADKVIELERLQNKIDQYKVGTQARLDAEIEFNNRKQELENSITTKEDELEQLKIDRNKTALENVFNDENESFTLRLQALQQYNEMAQASTLLSEEEKQKIQKQTFEQEKVLQQQRIALTANTLGNIANLLGQNSKAGKAFAVAQALINTYQGVTAELATKTATPFEFGLKVANIATTVAIGLKSVRDIIKTNPSSSGGSGGASAGGGGGVSAPAPQFNLVGNTGVNQIAQTLNEQPPARAYVVGGDVTSQQALDRNLVNNATIG
jgi:hypothetical protein